MDWRLTVLPVRDHTSNDDHGFLWARDLAAVARASPKLTGSHKATGVVVRGFGGAPAASIEALPGYAQDRGRTCCAPARIIAAPDSVSRIQAMAAAHGHSLAADMAARGVLQEPVEVRER